MARKRAEDQPEAPTGPPMTDAERAELDARLASMFSKPLKSELGGDRFFLLWMARDESGDPQVMVWNPETPDELRAANFFHDAAHGLGDFARKVKPGKPVRRSADEKALISAILANAATTPATSSTPTTSPSTATRRATTSGCASNSSACRPTARRRRRRTGG